MMNKKNYETAAKIVKDMRENPGSYQQMDPMRAVEDAFSLFFEQDNPKFDRANFSSSCAKR